MEQKVKVIKSKEWEGIHRINGRWLRWLNGRHINRRRMREGGDPCSRFLEFEDFIWERNVENDK